MEHASLGEVPERRVGAQGGDVAHVDDAVGDEGHGAVERRQGEQHERGLRGASSSAARRGSTPPRRGPPSSAAWMDRPVGSSGQPRRAPGIVVSPVVRGGIWVWGY